MIDWYSFTLHQAKGLYENAEGCRIVADMLLQKYTGRLVSQHLGNPYDMYPMASRPPYRYGFQTGDRDFRIFGHPDREEMLFELTGRGCERLAKSSLLNELVNCTKDRVTRIDIAIDFPTITPPTAFVGAGYSKKFKAHSELVSSKGETCYVGSLKSDLFARVYRYNPPHPRADLLRIEHVFRRNRAKVVAGAIASGESQTEIERRAFATFQWKHFIVSTLVTVGNPFPTSASVTTHVSRQWWLYSQVAPAIAKALADGSLDWDDYVAHVSGILENKQEFLVR